LNTCNQNTSLKRWGLEERSPEEALLLQQGRESARHGQSLAERRKNDRNLSKLYKSIQRGNIKRR
jgi:hypothetical protein